MDVLPTHSLRARDERVIWHPFTPQKNRPGVIPIVSGKGAMLFDDQGQSYIDAISSWWVNLHGHAHPYIAERLYRQALTLEHVIFAGFTHEPAVALAEKLLPILPGAFSRIFYSDNGSTATEVAIKMALQYHWNRQDSRRTKILALRNSYHGDTFGAMSVSERSVFTLAFHEKLFEVVFVDPTAASLAFEKYDPREFACFIYEPLVQGAGGMCMYPAAWLEETIATCRKNEVICIADEVMTGFGRTGRMFCSEYLAASPDIICLSKGLTGGTMPLGVTAVTHEVYEAFVSDDNLKTFFHGHSFTANPLACTAALASLDLFEAEGTHERIETISLANHQLLTALHQVEGIKSPRQLGTIVAFEIDEGENGYLNAVSPRIQQMARARGVYLRPLGNTVYIMPPYCIGGSELQQVHEIVLECARKR